MLQEEVTSLFCKGAVEVISHISPGFYGHLFCVPKASGGWRPVLDLSFLNRFLKRVRFRMETNTSVRESIRPGDWGASIDLTDAYFHIPIHPRDRKWLRFVWEGKVFQFCALPFGLSLAPWIFTKVSRELCNALHLRGMRVHIFLDDWLVLAQSHDVCNQQVQSLLASIREVGFIPNLGKSDLLPSQEFSYLGMRFDTRSFRVAPI